MYNDDCLPDDNVNEPRRADLSARSVMSACLSFDDIA
jgi:hypothetical protein